MIYNDVVDEQKAMIDLKYVAESRVEHRPVSLKTAAIDRHNRR